MISIENKLKICARLFYTENLDEYEDYREAVTEFISNQPSEGFLDFAIGPVLDYKHGFEIYFSQDGHVIAVSEDGFCLPRTDMTEAEGEELQAKTMAVVDNFTNAKDLFESLGWTRVETKQ